MEKNVKLGPRANKSERGYIENILTSTLSKREANLISPVALAWIGDGVFSDAVRKYLLIAEPSTIERLHKSSTNLVRAQAQSAAAHALLKNELSEEEVKVFKHGRNTASHVPKHSSVSEYRYATGFEALLGWLSLTGQTERLTRLCSLAIAEMVKETDESKT